MLTAMGALCCSSALARCSRGRHVCQISIAGSGRSPRKLGKGALSESRMLPTGLSNADAAHVAPTLSGVQSR